MCYSLYIWSFKIIMTIETVISVKEFLYLLHKTEYIKYNWFRGHKEATYRLEPTLYRNKKAVISGEGIIKFRHFEVEDEDIALKEFRKNFTNQIDNYKYNDLDFLYLMQHNGINTRLLDFTLNPLIALFFSVVEDKEDKKKQSLIEKGENNEFDDNCAAVFCVDPLKINLLSFQSEKIIDFAHISFKRLRQMAMPVCIEPAEVKIDRRLEIQKGRFIFFGSEVKELDWYEEPRKHILKILIPDEHRSKILKELHSKFNINYSTVYPDYEGLKKYVNQKTKGRLKKI